MSAGGLCKDCVSGTIHDGTPSGKVEKINGLDCYVTEPFFHSKAIIVIITDAFGWEFNNNRIMADNYATKVNVKVLMPDFFGGCALDHSIMDSMETIMSPKAGYLSKFTSVLHSLYHFPPFMFRNREAITKPRVYNFFRALRHDNPAIGIGAAGFCWGGKYTTYLCAGWNNASLDPYPSSNIDIPEASRDKEEYLVDCGFIAHPSALTIPRDMETLKKPLSFAHAKEDFLITPENMKTIQKIFDEKYQQDPKCELVVYENAKHGFAVRWNPEDERQQKQGEECEQQAIKWLVKYFRQQQGLST